ncbi:hypothetical protein AXF42_Ash003265 [Apostasia shenzhenica]|uniref:Programmed cell death protein 2 C-terminal domain-containing protein n=1 Tax=Apostasia shenzhenica TaxID=1088818 RepID=A0A2I0BFM9_9ASPA|nr:hypothetical protein AXF42_Ash003265 [Apostasia shenzhenica]
MKSEMRGVILGMPGPWAEDLCERSDHYTTKIGGLPDWPIPDMCIEPDILKCVICGNRLCLVAQIYAPMSLPNLNIEERVIYILGCLTPKCGRSHQCLRVLRVQKCTGEKLLHNPFQDSLAGSSAQTSSTKIAQKEVERDKGESVQENYDDLDLDELARELTEASAQASRSKSLNGSSIFDAPKKTTPLKPTLNEVSLRTLVVPCFYIYPQEEQAFGGVAAVCTSLTGLSTREDDSSADYKEAEEWEGEGYEYDKALGADRTYLKFKKRMDAYPEQCFRYSFGGKPLLAISELGEPNACGLCGSPRQYEMQLMPPLLYFLQEAANGLSACTLEEWDWMTLIVYSCSKVTSFLWF